MSVFDLKVGESGIIKSVGILGEAYLRLNSLGFIVGKKVTVLSKSLFKSSLLIACGAVRAGMRKSLCQSIEVEKCS